MSRFGFLDHPAYFASHVLGRVAAVLLAVTIAVYGPMPASLPGFGRALALSEECVIAHSALRGTGMPPP